MGSISETTRQELPYDDARTQRWLSYLLLGSRYAVSIPCRIPTSLVRTGLARRQGYQLPRRSSLVCISVKENTYLLKLVSGVTASRAPIDLCGVPK